MSRFGWWGLILVLVSACTKKNPDYCASDVDCDDVLRPFCDVAGEFEESGFEDNSCIQRPAGCAVERCGCTPGQVLRCEASSAEVCNDDGRSVADVPCGLGCSSDTACQMFEPSNGLGPALASSVAEQDITLPPGTVLDTDLGSATANGVAIPIASIVVAQSGAQPIRAFVARSFTMDAITVQGQSAVAFVAAGDVLLRGAVTARGTGALAGPGSQTAPAACVGQSSQYPQGGAGGGHATVGGDGGGPAFASSPIAGGGAPILRFEPLVGGCPGGSASGAGTNFLGGAGGGAIQIVANGRVSFIDTGLIDVGAGGGAVRAGGGSGGMVVIEAPRVIFMGPATGIFANGGSGGGCGIRGTDGARSATVAMGAKCTPSLFDATTASAGNGGAALMSPESAVSWMPCSPMLVCALEGGGGGGAVGTAKIATRTGTYEASSNPTLSAVISQLRLVPQ